MKGSHFELDHATCPVKPLQKPTPPIWIGANADVAIRRAARIGDCWYINPHNTLATIERQMDLYKRALDEYGKPFPAEVPMRREVFVAPTRAEAIRLAQPYLEEKYKAYRAWGQDKVMPEGDDFDHEFDELLEDRFLLGSPAEVAEQMIRLNRGSASTTSSPRSTGRACRTPSRSSNCRYWRRKCGRCWGSPSECRAHPVLF